MTTVLISIGHRDRDGNLLPNRFLSELPSDLRCLAEVHRATILAQGTSVGTWGGVDEVCSTILFDIDPDKVPGLIHQCEYLRNAYQQDAVGFVIHDHATYPESYV